MGGRSRNSIMAIRGLDSTVPGPPGDDGVSAYVYIAYASAIDGTGFTLTNDNALDYMAIKASATVIATPVIGDFTGLWFKRRGEGSTGEIWTVLPASYASASTITMPGIDKDVALAQFSLFTCTDSAGTTRRCGFVKSSVNNSGTITHTIVSTSNLAAGDKDFKIAYNRKIEDYQHLVSLPGQLVASSTESIGVWKLNIKAASKLISSDIAVITPAAGSGAALAWNVYSGATALYGTAPNAGANATLVDQRPTTIDLAAGANISVRLTSVGGATNFPADVQVTLFIVPTLIFTAF